MPDEFTTLNYHFICDQLALQDSELKMILDTYGYPPLWSRANTFETLVHITLEQQVSLASALSALNKLKERMGEITADSLLRLTDEELKACYLSRQKASYIKLLASAINDGLLDLNYLEQLENDDVRQELTALKGIGNWTTDIYLMFVLHRADVFPVGDLAAVNALKAVKNLPKQTSREELVNIARKWSPYRTIACMILWHYYLSKGKV
jgi:DNA-3-methyladenine glycosylase II